MFTVVSSYDGPAFEQKSSRMSVLRTTVHEFAHMWYYAALGTNESDYAWMDEGFTSYATAEGMAHLTGTTASHSPAVVARFQKLGLFESLSTPADWFQTNLGYGVASYPGGEMVVDLLGYVIGEENRDQWLRRYLRERTYQHPDPFDVEKFAEQESGLMLDWYFWQFTRSTRTLDDAITDLSQRRTEDGYAASFTLTRKGEAVLPHDVKLTLANGSTQWVNVPLLTMHGHKPVPDDWIVTVPWPWVQPEKTFTVEVPAPVESATLDPKARTPDLNRLNNTTSFPLRTRFLHAPSSNWSQYELGIRPLAGYAQNFGAGGGVQARGQYFRGDHRLRAMLTLWPEVLLSNGKNPSLSSGNTGTWFTGLDYELRYERSFSPFGPRSTLGVSAVKHLGVLEHRLRLTKPLSSPLRDRTETLALSVLHQLTPSDRVFGAARAGGANPFGQSHLLSTRLQHTITNQGDRVHAALEVGGSLNNGDQRTRATHFSLEARKTRSQGPLTLQADLQAGLGVADLASQKQFRLGGRSVEAQWRDDAFRQTSAALADPAEDAHLTAFGPAGPVAYLRTDRAGAFAGSNTLAGRLSVSGAPFPSVNPLSPLTLSLFSGVGTVWSGGGFASGFDPDNLVGDAGVGARYDVGSIPHLDRWTAQSDVLNELEIVAKFPLWASDPGLIDQDQDPFAARWLIGVEL